MNFPLEENKIFPRSRVSAQIRALERRELTLLKEAQEPERARREIPFGSAPLWEAWFRRSGWEPYKFQREAWAAYARGESGVIGVPTGSGKTYAALGGPLLRMLDRGAAPGATPRLRMLYIAPLKALARDVAGSLERPLRELDLPFSVGIRTGDTDTTARAKLKKGYPEILVTTPESLALLTAEINWRERFASLECIVVDEWHELLGTKRGSLLELTLSRVRACVPGAQTWSLSATLGNLAAAGAVAAGRDGVTVVRDNIVRETEIRAILPRETLPWFGTAALRLKAELLEEINPRESTILFTNTRSQAELWYNTLLAERPEWEELLALHHGSLAREERERVEAGVKAGEIKVVVATSSLDLGVDFPHVSKVIQVGSVKTVTRALQRGGRSEHSMGRKSRLVILPTTLFDLVETGALREALRLGALETREPLPQPADVLLQFMLNSAFEGYGRTEITGWIRGAWSFRGVTDEQIRWGLDFLSGQGKVLRNNADFRKLECIDDKYRFSSPRLARLHRLNIGTILAGGGMSVQFLSGKKLGTIDEQFLTRLKKGDVFQFSGKALQIVQVRDMLVYVRLAKSKRMIPAVWNGLVLPVSRALSDLTRAEWTRPSEGSAPERRALSGLIALQALRSHVPAEDEVLIEQWRTKAGFHTFLYLFEGRLVHEGLGHLLAYRLSRLKPNTISVSANDQGLELLSTEPLGDQAGIYHALSKSEGLAADIESSLNFPELVKRAFREVARVAGLVQQAVPGLQKSVRQVQMSTGLLYEVFVSHDPENPLIQEAREQARREQLDFPRLERAVHRASSSKPVFRKLDQLSPFSLPLYVERVRSQVSTEELADRVARLQKELFSDGHPST